jgi:hypothetical protein
MITEVWFEDIDGTTEGTLKFRNPPESKGLRPAIIPREMPEMPLLPRIGEHVAWRGQAVGGDDASMPLDLVVDIKTFYYLGEDGATWVQEIHVMTTARD